MQYKSVIMYLFLIVFMMKESVCSEHKKEEKSSLRLHERKKLGLLLTRPRTISPIPDRFSPRNEIELQCKKNVEEHFPHPCLGEIRTTKQVLRQKAYEILTCQSSQEIIARKIDSKDGLLDAQALYIAQMVVFNKAKFSAKINSNELQIVNQLLDDELKRFIVPIQAHQEINQPIEPTPVENVAATYDVDDVYPQTPSSISRPEAIRVIPLSFLNAVSERYTVDNYDGISSSQSSSPTHIKDEYEQEPCARRCCCVIQ